MYESMTKHVRTNDHTSFKFMLLSLCELFTIKKCFKKFNNIMYDIESLKLFY